MTALTLISVLISIFPGTARADSLPIYSGPFEMVVCMSDGALNVRGDNLKDIQFSVPNFEPLKVFQGWGENKKVRTVGSSLIPYLKVQFPLRESRAQPSVGWVAEALVKMRSQCAGANPPVTARPKPVPESPDMRENVKGLNDVSCCQFPTKAEPLADFNSGIRKFASGRGGRLHAACDLYRTLGEPISSVAPGTVVRDKYFFYQGTYAMEVRHSGGFVVRYGEITGKSAQSVSNGSKVEIGQTIGYMGKVGSKCCEPMLHFELYAGTRTGSLTGGGKFQRRADLLNPTEYLSKWEENSFKLRK